jgi:hypothetical protein
VERQRDAATGDHAGEQANEEAADDIRGHRTDRESRIQPPALDDVIQAMASNRAKSAADRDGNPRTHNGSRSPLDWIWLRAARTAGKVPPTDEYAP